MAKKYDLKYTLATISTFFISFVWPISWFLLYMFKDEKDEHKIKLLRKLEICSYAWIILQVSAIIFKVLSNVMQ